MRRVVTRRRLLVAAAVLVSPIVLYFVLDLLFPLPTERLVRPPSVVVEDRTGEPLREFPTPDGDKRRAWVTRDDLPLVLVHAVLAAEDKRFFQHHGVDPLAMARAIGSDLKAREIVSGGSTLTMQLARMMDGRPRTLGAKAIEAFRALQIERRLTKDEILTRYLNLAPYGGNVEGVASAARAYLGKDVSKVSLDEAALLAAIPNAPSILRPDRATGQERLKARRDLVLARMEQLGFIDARQRGEAERTPVPTTRRPPPFKAPHMADLVRARFAESPRIRTTLDSSVQRMVEQVARDHAALLAGRGIRNLAVVVVDNETRAVRALVGSPDFFDVSAQGQVDAAAAPRSPGSALKPFLYGLALDRGLLTPSMLLPDAPVDYGGWTPHNFDGSFHGLVSAQEALSRSLNVPAVHLESLLRPDGLYALLRKAHLSTLRDESSYGLAIALGGCEVTLLELAGLYAALADGGRFVPLRLREDQPQEQAISLLSPEAAYLVTDMISAPDRPELAEAARHALGLPRIAWKTGTSYGRRDAWAVGYTRRYTVGVWTGNVDNDAKPENVGVQAAAPLLLRIFQGLPKIATDAWFEEPQGIEHREVCALSGLLPERECPHRKQELAIRNVSPVARCAMHRSIEVDDHTGERLCSHCRMGRSYHRVEVTVWPTQLSTWLKQAGYPVSDLPAHARDCTSPADGDPPAIRAPSEGDEFVLRPEVPASQQTIRLQASTGGGTQLLHWFLDGRLVSSAPPGTDVPIEPTPGAHRVACMDDEGRTSQLRFSVKSL